MDFFQIQDINGAKAVYYLFFQVLCGMEMEPHPMFFARNLANSSVDIPRRFA